MNNENILDDLRENQKEIPAVRGVAIFLEGLPVLFIFCGIFLSTAAALLGVIMVSGLYLFMSWYLFKGSRYKTSTVVTAQTGGLVIFMGILALLFKLESWPGAQTLIATSLVMAVSLSGYLLYRFITKKEDPLEYRFSLKLLSRLLIYILLFGYFYIFI